MKHILAVSHCILNTASKVAQDESGLAEEYRQRGELLRTAIDKGVQLLQLPCPEFMLYGSRRWGHVKDQFDNPFFRGQCRSMLEPVMLQLREYASEPERFCLLGIAAVEGSPSCGATRTCRASDWGGEFDVKACGDLAAAVSEVNEPGVFMEVITEMLAENGLELPLLSISEAKEQIETVLG